VVCFLKPVSVVGAGRKYINQVLNLGLGNLQAHCLTRYSKAKEINEYTPLLV
jgi:hypothetical protein